MRSKSSKSITANTYNEHNGKHISTDITSTVRAADCNVYKSIHTFESSMSVQTVPLIFDYREEGMQNKMTCEEVLNKWIRQKKECQQLKLRQQNTTNTNTNTNTNSYHVEIEWVWRTFYELAPILTIHVLGFKHLLITT